MNQVIRIAIILYLVSILTYSAAATEKSDFKLSSQPSDLPNAGLKLKILLSSKESPLPPPTVGRYQIKDGNGKLVKEGESYLPRDLWLADQFIGAWTDESGNTMCLMKPAYPLPDGFKRQQVDKDEYKEAVSTLISNRTEWTEDELEKFISDYAGAAELKKGTVDKIPSNLKSVSKYNIESPKKKGTVYIFTPSRTASAPQKDNDRYIAYFTFGPLVSSDKATRLLDTAFLPSISSSTTPSQFAQKNDMSKLFQNKPNIMQSKSSSTNKSPEFLESREMVRSSIKNMKDWWSVETDNFIILSNLKPKFKALVQDLQNNVEYFRDAFEQFIPPFTEIKAVSVIRVFGTPEEYKAYVPENMAWSGGIWMPMKKELVIKPLDAGSGKDQKERVLKTTYHEAFHQYIFYAMDMIDTAPWFNEGHAQLFEEAKLSGKSIEIGEEPNVAAYLEDLYKKNIADVEKLLKLTHPQFYAGSDEDRKKKYAMAWALVYYLRKYAPLENKQYAEIPVKYAKALWETKDAQKATDIAFDGIDLKKLNDDMHKFWTSSGQRAKAKSNKILKDFKIK